MANLHVFAVQWTLVIYVQNKISEGIFVDKISENAVQFSTWADRTDGNGPPLPPPHRTATAPLLLNINFILPAGTRPAVAVAVEARRPSGKVMLLRHKGVFS